MHEICPMPPLHRPQQANVENGCRGCTTGVYIPCFCGKNTARLRKPSGSSKKSFRQTSGKHSAEPPLKGLRNRQKVRHKYLAFRRYYFQKIYA